MGKKVVILLLAALVFSMVSTAYGQEGEKEKIKDYIGRLEEKLNLAKKEKDNKRVLKIWELIKEQKLRLKRLALPKVVKPEISLKKKAPPPAPGVSGTFYIRYLKGLTNSAVINNFDIDRAYLTFKGNLSDNFAYSVTLDSARAAGMMYTFLKYAYVDLNNVVEMDKNNLNVRVGLQPTFWSTWVDGYFGMRIIASSMVGLDGGVTTSDFGLGGLGKIDLAGLSANYLVTALNGSSFTAVENNSSKNIAGRVDSEVLPGVTVGVGGQVENVGSSSAGAKLATALVGCKNDELKSYLELLYGKGTLGISAAGSYALGGLYGIFGRVDIYDPNRSINDDGLTRIWTGVTYDWNKNVKLVLDYDAVSYASAAATNAGKTVSQAAVRTQIVF